MKNTTSLLCSFLLITTLTFAQNSSSQKVEPESTIKDSLSIAVSSEMLDEEVYWGIIEHSLKESTSPEDQEIYLVNEIEKLSPKEMIGFRLRTDKLLFDSYTSDLWCAAYIMDGGCSDDGFEYFRCWLISRGKDTFYKAKENPDSLIDLVKEERGIYEFEGFWYVAVNAFKNATDKELYSYIDYDAFVTNDENYPLLNFTWNVDEPQSMKKVCPQLYDKLWK
ncbi:DUF4240 domain-containing protein [Flavobacterium sp.]|uniref:DUF4240 domain-containing protein n=1 Tax=Flavobacterium sp. TaxID=239 RepID=UPI00260DD119|nr:DUF4240 domain-containing protein [Flavobacterium sp.]MDG2431033.1 DUF4240 domain-containing protein [Flavobacterium sp.]